MKPDDVRELARIKALFLEVVDLADEPARRAHLQASGADAATMARVLDLVAQDAEAAASTSNTGLSRLRAPVLALLGEVLADAPELSPGDRIGPWTLGPPLGEGGMGRVHLAERSDGLYRQQVAIKLLRGRGDAMAQALLARERQILASLRHPHIARLLDGGSTPGGRPYLVLEYVRGQRIDAWCRAQRLDLAARLRLFAQVCEAVAHAHRQLVVHCDIKPANVLVGDDGQAMLLDFGIARLDAAHHAGHDGDDPVPQARGLTPRYASPEQQAGAAATAASDIHGLGRLLQEMLADIAERAPRRHEWQAIIDRACAPDPARRYADVAALLDDLRRFHRHQALAALADRGPAQARAHGLAKLLRRRWPWVLAGAAALLMASAFALRLVHERDRALLAEALARQETAATQQVAELMVGLFEGADPAVSGRPDIGAAAIVERGRERVAADLAQQPELRARMQAVLGRVYEQMGRPRQAIPLFEAAIAEEQRLGRSGLEAALQARLAMALANSGEAGRAVAPARRALALQQAQALAAKAEPGSGPAAPRELAGLTRGPTALADALDTLGFVLSRTGAHDEARQHLQQGLALRRQHLGPQHLQIAVSLHHLGMLESARGAPEAAEPWLRQALAMKQALLRAPHPSLLNTLQQLASTLAGQQRLDEAEALLRDLLAQRRALFGALTAPVGTTLNELAGVLQDAGRLTEAIATYREAIAVDETVHGRQSTATAVVINNLGTALEDAGDAAAEAAFRESLATRRARLPADDLVVARAEHNLGRWLLRQGRLDEARGLLQQALATRRAKLAPGQGDRVDSELLLAELALRQGRVAEAAAGLAEVATHEATLRPPRRIALWRAQGLLLAAQGDAVAAQQRRQAALELAQRTWPAGHGALRRLQRELAAPAPPLSAQP